MLSPCKNAKSGGRGPRPEIHTNLPGLNLPVGVRGDQVGPRRLAGGNLAHHAAILVQPACSRQAECVAESPHR